MDLAEEEVKDEGEGPEENVIYPEAFRLSQGRHDGCAQDGISEAPKFLFAL